LTRLNSACKSAVDLYSTPRVEALQTGGDHEPGALLTEIPLDLERRLERRWAARFFRAKRSDLKCRINQMLHPATAEYPQDRPPARNGESMIWQRQEAEALPSGPIGDVAENDLLR
jgi:hypothetical protein